MKKPRKRQGAEYEFMNMFMDAINWDKVNSMTDAELKAVLDKTGKNDKNQNKNK